MGRVVGIDLGTTNSVVGFVEGSEPRIIPLSEGSPLCPSVVAFTKAGERLVGPLAKRQSVTNPERTIVSIKRRMGSDYSLTIDGRTYTPQEISAFILMKLKQDAEAYLGEEVTGAVITCPAYFSDAQRQATKDAGTIAGLDVLRIINEPTAAALAYGLDRQGIGTVLVWDLGGGTFDVSILEISDGIFEVKATSGDTHLGGDDWDERLVDYLAAEFQAQNGIDLRKDRIALQRLREASERAKTELSTLVQTSINLPFVSSTPDGPLHLDTMLTRAKFEELTADLLERMKGPTLAALEDARLKPEQVDKVLLVGGATRMPAVQRLIAEIMGKEPTRGTNPDEVVAAGAAIQANIVSGGSRDIVLLDVTPLSLGIETLGGVFTRVIERNTTIPASNTMTFTTAEDGQQVVEIKVYQGEREMAADNKRLGSFLLSGIPPAPRNVPQIDVTFDIDVNGIVNVSARDQATGAERKIVITAAGGITREEVERMKNEAAGFAEEDRRKREAAETRNKAQGLLWAAEKTVKEQADAAPADLTEAICKAIEELRTALNEGDDEKIGIRHEILMNIMYKLTSSLYEKSGTEPPEFPRDAGGFRDSRFAEVSTNEGRQL